jgi:hypothetical protein
MGGGKKASSDRTVADDRITYSRRLGRCFSDEVRYGCIVVKGGTHIMILNKYRWLNANLPLFWIIKKLRTDLLRD